FLLLLQLHLATTLFPYTTLFRSIYSGGRGKERNLTENSKVGRPRKYTQDSGMNITEAVKKQFSYVIKKYYRKKEQLSLMETYERSEEHTSELQSRENLVCRLLLE